MLLLIVSSAYTKEYSKSLMTLRSLFDATNVGTAGACSHDGGVLKCQYTINGR